MVRNPPGGYVAEVLHTYKERVPTENVINGNYDRPSESGSI